MTLPPHPNDVRKTREKALELAARSYAAGIHTHMTEVATRAHYFAHYLADEDRNTLCDTVTCPYQVILVPLAPADIDRD
jgi:hypothetical protein